MRQRQRATSWRVTWSVAVFLIMLVVSLPITFAASYSLSYDANGNLVTGDGKFRVYNNFNRLAKIYNGTNSSGTLLEEFLYHPTQERILLKKVYNSSGSVIETVYYIADEFVSTTNASGRYNTTYFFANDQQVAQTLPNGVRQYLLTDVEGSAVVTTNSSGGVVERTSYAPFGAVLTGGASTRFDYEGREADNLVGDVDFRFRKYKPEWALFTQPDDIIQNIYDPQSLNRYAFERNNPYKYVDPSGHVYWDRLAEAALSGGLSLLAAGIGLAGAEFGGVSLVLTVVGVASAGYEAEKAWAALTENDDFFQEHEDNIIADTWSYLDQRTGAERGNLASAFVSGFGFTRGITNMNNVPSFGEMLDSIGSAMDFAMNTLNYYRASNPNSGISFYDVPQISGGNIVVGEIGGSKVVSNGGGKGGGGGGLSTSWNGGTGKGSTNAYCKSNCNSSWKPKDKPKDKPKT